MSQLYKYHDVGCASVSLSTSLQHIMVMDCWLLTVECWWSQISQLLTRILPVPVWPEMSSPAQSLASDMKSPSLPPPSPPPWRRQTIWVSESVFIMKRSFSFCWLQELLKGPSAVLQSHKKVSRRGQRSLSVSVSWEVYGGDLGGQ